MSETLCDPWTVARQAPLSMGFFRQECWSGLPCPPPGVLPEPGIEPASPMSPSLAGGFFTTRATWEFLWTNWSLSIANKYISWIYYFPPRKQRVHVYLFLYFTGEVRGIKAYLHFFLQAVQHVGSILPTRDWTCVSCRTRLPAWQGQCCRCLQWRRCLGSSCWYPPRFSLVTEWTGRGTLPPNLRGSCCTYRSEPKSPLLPRLWIRAGGETSTPSTIWATHISRLGGCVQWGLS